jgi:predicted transcriptional regulator
MVSWSRYYEEEILKMLPVDGSEMRAQELYRTAWKKRRFSSATVNRHLPNLIKKKFVERIQKSHKEVYYSRREMVRVEHLINDFVQEIGSILSSEVPVRLDKDKSVLIEGSLRKDEARYMAGMLRSCPVYLENVIIHTVLRKVHKMVIASGSEKLKDTEYYIGAFDDGSIRLYPRSYIEKASWFQERSAKR